jgi:hypothetical protein
MTRAEHLKQTIADAQKELDTLSIEGQRERNRLNQQQEFTAAQNALNDSRSRHEALVNLSVTHLDDLRKVIDQSFLFNTSTGMGGTIVKTHANPANPQFDQTKRGAVDAAALKLATTLITLAEFSERLKYTTEKFNALSASVYVNVAPAVEAAQPDMVTA